MKNLTRSGLVGAALTAFACSQAACATDTSDEQPEQVVDTNDAIVGGKVSTDGAWPGAVAVYKSGYQACGGTLVAPSWVVTAAHCVTTSQTNGGFSKVVIGTNKLTGSGGESRTVDRAFRHERYSSSGQDNDIALIHLSTPSTKPVAKIVSSAQLSKVVAGANTTVVGWGTMSEGGNTSNDLREVDVPIISDSTCKTYSGYSRITTNMICAGFASGGRDSCQGDSGGPLFQKIDGQNVQIGVVSWGLGCARANAPGVYTRIGNYLAWLKTSTNGAVDPNAGTTTTTGSTSGGTASGPTHSAPATNDGDDDSDSTNNDWWTWWW
ncbi:MAG: serine protease [Labilithrix sp.]